MDVSKLRFNIEVSFDCDEGEDCFETIENGTYDKAIKLFETLNSCTWISGYYHYFSINRFDINDENDKPLELDKILNGDFEWLADGYSTSDKFEASEIPADVIKFLQTLKHGDGWFNMEKVKELQAKISRLEKELEEARAEMKEYEGKM